MLIFLLRLLLPLLTLPGIVIHEAAHALFCRLTGTGIVRVCLFRFALPPGYVIHEAPTSPWRHAWIASGPFFLNTAMGLLLGWSAAFLAPSPTWRLALYWLAISIAAHAFPSLQDATGLLEALWKRRAGWIARICLTPLGALMVAGSFGAMYLLLDVIYGLAAGWLVPRYALPSP